MTLTESLLARYDEEDAQGGCGGPDSTCDQLSGKWLAQVEANRRIVELRRAADVPAHRSSFVRGQDDGFRQGLDEALLALALPFAEHPDYEEGWKP